MEETFKDRLVKEQKELEDKFVKLSKFIDSEPFNGIAEVQKALLRAQAPVMSAYNQILIERIKQL